MTAQELLEVEDGQRVVLRQRQQLAQGRIRLDGLLVHQVVRTGVGHHRLGHGGAAHLRVLGQGQEGAQLGGDLHGLGEDAGLGLAALRRLRLAAATAVRLLRQASRLLLQRLQRRQRGLESRLHAAQLLVELLEALQQHGAVCGRLGLGRHGRHRRRHGHGRLLGLLGLLCRLLLCHYGSSHYGLRGLGRRLGGRLGLARTAHYVLVGGRFGRHGTRMITGYSAGERVKFVKPGAKVARIAGGQRHF